MFAARWNLAEMQTETRLLVLTVCTAIEQYNQACNNITFVKISAVGVIMMNMYLWLIFLMHV